MQRLGQVTASLGYVCTVVSTVIKVDEPALILRLSGFSAVSVNRNRKQRQRMNKDTLNFYGIIIIMTVIILLFGPDCSAAQSQLSEPGTIYVTKQGCIGTATEKILALLVAAIASENEARVYAMLDTPSCMAVPGGVKVKLLEEFETKYGTGVRVSVVGRPGVVFYTLKQALWRIAI